MPKLKFNEDKETFTLKNLDICHLELIRSILNITRLGNDDIYKDCAYDLINATDALLGDADWWEDCKVAHSIDGNGDLIIEVNCDYGEDEPECSGSCSGCKCR